MIKAHPAGVKRLFIHYNTIGYKNNKGDDDEKEDTDDTHSNDTVIQNMGNTSGNRSLYYNRE